MKKDLANLAEDLRKRREQITEQIESTDASKAINTLREQIEALRARLAKTATREN